MGLLDKLVFGNTVYKTDNRRGQKKYSMRRRRETIIGPEWIHSSLKKVYFSLELSSFVPKHIPVKLMWK